ncbi:MAG: BamA/TamA family outer membrane protein, partial [Gemmatimonadaceae bacterium]
QRNLYLSGMFAEVEMRTPPPDSMAHVAQQRDSATAVVALSDSVRRDTAARDSVKRDTVARSSVRRDTVTRVTMRSDSLNNRAARRDSTNGEVTDLRSFATDSARRARRLRRLVADTAKIVRLRVTEAQLHRLDLTGGFSTADFAQFEAALTRYNLWGAGRRVTLRGTLANIGAPQLSGSGPFYDVANGTEGSTRNAFLSPIWATSLDFTQPWFLSPRNQLGASLFAHRRTIPGIAIDRGKGATIALTREHGPRVSTTLGYTYEASTVDASDVYFCVTFGVCVRSSISAVSRGNAIAPIALATIIDQSDNALSPSNGYRARIELEHASAYTLSDFRYNRIALTGTRYIRMSARNVLAGRIRLGWVNALGTTADALNVTGASGEEVIHPRKRFFAGGSQSVRGFGENQLGPRVLTVAPEKFTKAPNDTTPALCTVQQLRNLTCDPNSARLSASDFAPQPLGGTSIAEGSIEFRFPLRFYTGLSGALFVDGALIGTDRFSSILGATGAVTPGFGFRLSTPVGPVRLDLGVRPTLSERLPVITQVADSLGNATLVTLKTTRQYSPVDASGNILRQILGRLTLHLSVGPAF